MLIYHNIIIHSSVFTLCIEFITCIKSHNQPNSSERIIMRCQRSRINQQSRLEVSGADRSPRIGLGQRTRDPKPPPFRANLASTRSRSPGDASPRTLRETEATRARKTKPKSRVNSVLGLEFERRESSRERDQKRVSESPTHRPRLKSQAQTQTTHTPKSSPCTQVHT